MLAKVMNPEVSDVSHMLLSKDNYLFQKRPLVFDVPLM